MKYLFTLIFTSLFGLSINTFASATADAAKHDTQCGAEDKTQTCNDTKADTHKATGHHGGLSEKMNSLFPEKQKKAELGARPSLAAIIAPSFLAQVGAGNIKLEWKEAIGASDYHVQVATDPNFKWLVADEKFVKNTSFDFKAEAGQRYFWRVASYKGDNAATFTKSNFVSSAFVTK